MPTAPADAADAMVNAIGQALAFQDEVAPSMRQDRIRAKEMTNHCVRILADKLREFENPIDARFFLQTILVAAQFGLETLRP